MSFYNEIINSVNCLSSPVAAVLHRRAAFSNCTAYHEENIPGNVRHELRLRSYTYMQCTLVWTKVATKDCLRLIISFHLLEANILGASSTGSFVTSLINMLTHLVMKSTVLSSLEQIWSISRTTCKLWTISYVHWLYSDATIEELVVERCSLDRRSADYQSSM